MTSLRTTLVGLTAVSLLATPAVATAVSTTPETGTRSTATPTNAQTQALPARHDTRIRFLRFDHTRPFDRKVRIRGQVAARKAGQWGALQGVRVVLYRKLDGRSRWVRLDRKYTSQQAFPKFKFGVRAKANARYRVVYPGNRRFQPSGDVTHVLVHRVFNAVLEDGTGRFHGRVQPKYHRKVIRLEKRRCAPCGWNVVRHQKTNRKGFWSFHVGAPGSGRTWWRATTPGSVTYIRSSSGVFTTQRS